ncbi:hypothetical protein INT50_08255 [Vibrio diabolicus]|uniref:hypothetical protein n=1 Tax=Vibrio diabolicus TaxID=50719 RepID=UPI0013E0D6EC|nr:hypothetical protein [Vibrio diabolicus]QOV28690.1 hypothetical protein INT50_08255 [Vibrio diabolicus]
MSAKTDKHQTYDLWRQTRTNAQLSSEQRNIKAAAFHRKHPKPLQTKTATRCESA